jgi:hypothetical protein
MPGFSCCLRLSRGLIPLLAALLLTVTASVIPAEPTRGGTLKLITQNDLKVLDPFWTTAYISRNHGYMIYDVLFASEFLGCGHTPQYPQLGEYHGGRPLLCPNSLLDYFLPRSLRGHDRAGHQSCRGRFARQPRSQARPASVSSGRGSQVSRMGVLTSFSNWRSSDAIPYPSSSLRAGVEAVAHEDETSGQ